MKLMRGMLLVLLGLTGLLHLVEGIASIADPAGLRCWSRIRTVSDEANMNHHATQVGSTLLSL